MERRRFLLLLGTTTTGVVFSTGLIELPRKMVLAAGGSCAFCNRRSEVTRGMAGMTGRPIRICSECVALCFELLAEEERLAANPPPPSFPPLSPPGATDREVEEWLASTGLADPTRHDAREQIREYPPAACSFCDTGQQHVRKLIAGPTTYICDGCIGDAAAFLHTWRDA